jgi:hypothetical protein
MDRSPLWLADRGGRALKPKGSRSGSSAVPPHVGPLHLEPQLVKKRGMSSEPVDRP